MQLMTMRHQSPCNDLSFKELEPIYDVDYDDAEGVGF